LIAAEIDSGTVAEIGTAVGTLVLAVAAFYATRMANRASRVAERQRVPGHLRAQRRVGPGRAAGVVRSDGEGGQPTISRFSLLPRDAEQGGDPAQLLPAVIRHWRR